VNALEVVVERAAVLEHGAELEVLAHGHLPEQAAILRDDRHAARDPGRHIAAVDLLAVEQHPPRPGTDDPEHGLQGRRLPGRVAAQQADELARADL